LEANLVRLPTLRHAVTLPPTWGQNRITASVTAIAPSPAWEVVVAPNSRPTIQVVVAESTGLNLTATVATNRPVWRVLVDGREYLLGN
jgi:hypothetical protein